MCVSEQYTDAIASLDSEEERAVFRHFLIEQLLSALGESASKAAVAVALQQTKESEVLL